MNFTPYLILLKKILPLQGQADDICIEACRSKHSKGPRKHLCIQDPFEIDQVLSCNNRVFQKLLDELSDAKEILQIAHSESEEINQLLINLIYDKSKYFKENLNNNQKTETVLRKITHSEKPYGFKLIKRFLSFIGYEVLLRPFVFKFPTNDFTTR